MHSIFVTNFVVETNVQLYVDCDLIDGIFIIKNMHEYSKTAEKFIVFESPKLHKSECKINFANSENSFKI